MSRAPRPPWTCPKCGRVFTSANQQHACTSMTVAEHLAGKNAEAVALYRRFEAAVRSVGSVDVVPTKTRVGFKARMTFAAVTLRKAHLACHVVLRRRLADERFTRVEELSPRCFVHHFVIRRPADVDDAVRAWLAEAREGGLQGEG